MIKNKANDSERYSKLLKHAKTILLSSISAIAKLTKTSRATTVFIIGLFVRVPFTSLIVCFNSGRFVFFVCGLNIASWYCAEIPLLSHWTNCTVFFSQAGTQSIEPLPGPD